MREGAPRAQYCGERESAVEKRANECNYSNGIHTRLIEIRQNSPGLHGEMRVQIQPERAL